MTKAEGLARAVVVDEIGSLTKELAPFKSKIARREELAKVCRSWAADTDAAEPFSVDGERFTVLLSPKGNETALNMVSVWTALGRKKFIQAASISLTALKLLLPEATIASLSSKEQTGSRTLTVTEKPQPVQ
jgi:hypothetical protein